MANFNNHLRIPPKWIWSTAKHFMNSTIVFYDGLYHVIQGYVLDNCKEHKCSKALVDLWPSNTILTIRMVTVGQVRRPYRHMNVHYRQDALLIIADLTKVGSTSIHPPVLLHQSGCPAAKKRQADFNRHEHIPIPNNSRDIHWSAS